MLYQNYLVLLQFLRKFHDDRLFFSNKSVLRTFYIFYQKNKSSCNYFGTVKIRTIRAIKSNLVPRIIKNGNNSKMKPKSIYLHFKMIKRNKKLFIFILRSIKMCVDATNDLLIN